jgi:hypothetical protein
MKRRKKKIRVKAMAPVTTKKSLERANNHKMQTMLSSTVALEHQTLYYPTK